MIALVMADDFTGANDCAGGFAESGFSCFSSLENSNPPPRIEVYVRSLETRFLAPDRARRKARQAWASMRGRARRISYVRMDSTLRGNPGEEISALLEATQARRVAFCAAFPEHGRIIRGGVAYVRGIRLDRSEYARDPLSPSRGPRPAALFPKALARRLPVQGLSALRRDIREGGARILCFDACTDAQLRRVARACLAEGVAHFAGSSGLSSALAAELRPARRPLRPKLPPGRAVLAGSVSQTILDQLEAMQKCGAAPWFDMESGGPRELAGGRFALSSIRRRSQMRRFSGPGGQMRFAEARLGALLKRGLALAGAPERSLWLLSGGHCAALFFSKLGLHGAWVRGMLLPGLPLLEARAGGGKPIFACSKPGGFGGPGLITDFMRLQG